MGATPMQQLKSKVVAEGLIFGEGPRWHDGRLWLSDMLGDKVYALTPDGALDVVVEAPHGASGLGWLPDGRMLFVSMRDAKLVAVRDGQTEVYADVSASRGTPNDMLVDAKGRAYVGNTGCDMFVEGINPRPTNLLLVENGRAREVASDLIFPNGMALTPDGKTLVVAETFAHRLTAFDVDPQTGSLSGRRVFADLGDKTPDGICMDAEGAVWISSAVTCEFVRVREGGEITHRIDTGGRFAAACAAGGPDRKTLYLITAHMTPELFAQKKTDSRIESVLLETAGAGQPRAACGCAAPCLRGHASGEG
jgi:sugar lactone lactonase YvrE